MDGNRTAVWDDRPPAASAFGGSSQRIGGFVPNFEDGQTGGWVKVPWMGDGSVAITSATYSEGSKSLAMTNRAASNSNHLGLDLSTKPGHTYDLSLKLKLGAGTDTFHIASNVAAASLTNQYPWLVGDKSVNSTEWTTPLN